MKKLAECVTTFRTGKWVLNCKEGFSMNSTSSRHPLTMLIKLCSTSSCFDSFAKYVKTRDMHITFHRTVNMYRKN